MDIEVLLLLVKLFFLLTQSNIDNLILKIDKGTVLMKSKSVEITKQSSPYMVIL